MPLTIIRQDITKIECDAVVNPTNASLIPGGGVDAAIHRGAGPRLAEALRRLGGCETGQAVITPAFDLPCKYIIHTVGPIWRGGGEGERALLASCYTKALLLAKRKRCRSIAFPLISSGACGFPKDRVLRIAQETVGAFLRENEMTVFLAVFDKASYELSEGLARDVSSYIEDRYVELNELPRMQSLFLDRRNDAKTPLGKRLCSTRESAMPAASFMGAGRKADSSPEEPTCEPVERTAPPVEKKSLDEMLRAMDKGFSETLFDYIDAKGMNDVECYKRANIDRKTFSKIKCSKKYKPSKATVLSFAIALRLTLDETNHLLNTVGMSLSRSSKFDVIIEYFIVNGKYDIYEINETLFAFDQVLLGA